MSFQKAAFQDANVCLFVFDCIYFNGVSLMERSVFSFCPPEQILYVFYQLFSLLELVSVVSLVSLEFFSKKKMPNLRPNTFYI